MVGAPPLLGFWPEFLTFTAGFIYGNLVIAILGLVAAALTAAYGLRLVRLVFFGPLKESYEGEKINVYGTGSLAIFAAFIILLVIGIFPGPAFALVKQAVNSLGFTIASF